MYHSIHLGLGKSPANPPQNDFIAKSLFGRPIFDPEKVPGPECRPRVQKYDPGLENPSLGMKQLKMRAEKSCRTMPSELQTEPYSASYDQNTFWKVPSKSWYMLQEDKSCFQEGHPVFEKGNPVFKRGIQFLRRTSCFQKGSPVS